MILFIVCSAVVIIPVVVSLFVAHRKGLISFIRKGE
jgi:hypothetical protein